MTIVQCTECGSNVEKSNDVIRRSKTGRFFCNRSCAASYNNKINPKRRLKRVFCTSCGCDLNRKSWRDRRTLCEDCNPNTIDWSTVTYGEVLEKRSYQKHSRIRDLARVQYLSSGRPQSCIHCGYDKHFDVCHIKAIGDHSEDTAVAEINNPSNLIALCKNHHWELDNGILSLDEIRGESA